jgi:hypothetical protein
MSEQDESSLNVLNAYLKDVFGLKECASAVDSAILLLHWYRRWEKILRKELELTDVGPGIKLDEVVRVIKARSANGKKWDYACQI